MTPQEHARLRRLVHHARRLGRDVLDHLNRNGALLTERRARRMRAEAMYEMAEFLEQASISEIIAWYGSGGNTALDAQRGTVAMLRNMAWKEDPNV